MAKNEGGRKGKRDEGSRGGGGNSTNGQRGNSNGGSGRGRTKKRQGGRGGGRGGVQTGSQYERRSKEERAAFQKERKAKIVSDVENLNEKKKEERIPLESSVSYERDTLSGEIEAVKDLDRRWIGELSFFEYLPSDNSPSQSLEALRFLNSDLRDLLLAPYHVFWSYVLLDKSFSLFLDSFLRYFDEPSLPLPDLQREEVDNLDADGLKGALFQRVFLVVCRMSQMEEATHLFMSSSFYSQEITKNHLLDLPKLIDFARLYGCHNRQKVCSTLKFLFYQVPRLKRDFTAALAVVAEEVDRAGTAAFDESGTTDMQGVLTALVDLAFTMASFVDLAPNCTLYAVRDNRQFLNILCYTHDATAGRLESLLPVEAFASKLLKLRRSIQALVYAVLERCYLGHLLLGRDKRNFSPEDATQEVVDIVCGIEQVVASFATLKGHPAPIGAGSLLIALEDAHSLSTSFRKVAAVVPSKREAVQRALAALPVPVQQPQDSFDEPTSMGSEVDSRAAEKWERERLPLVKMVKEILGPDFGDGFVDACLQHYNDSVEHVVAHVFDGSLHPSLQQLDQGMARPTFSRAVPVAAPAVIPFTVKAAADSRQVVKVHYGKKSKKEEEETVPDVVKGFAKEFVRTYQEDLLYNDEWDDSFDGQAPVRVAGDATSDEVSNLSISGTYDVDEEESSEQVGGEGSNTGRSSDSRGPPSKGGSSTRSYAQKRNRKKLAAKKRAV